LKFDLGASHRSLPTALAAEDFFLDATKDLNSLGRMREVYCCFDPESPQYYSVTLNLRTIPYTGSGVDLSIDFIAYAMNVCSFASLTPD
jgi:hypothetical protein